eukprot:scaffold495_cov405-Prasinococcus_capsulatus_cf.AAC.8
MWLEVLDSRVTRRETERLAMTAHMPKAEEALRIGLIDKIVLDESELLPAADALSMRLLRSWLSTSCLRTFLSSLRHLPPPTRN